jgi:N-methylhydantoinase B
VHWRFFTKTKIFAVIRDTEKEPDVGAAFASVRRDYPQVPDITLAAE